ncbi:MAG: hypothetical protein GY820_26425 [Gammaproteobacteria bacterium]|nr:hypothetical protein [Gammaproteobacteria bacterium]
MFLITFIFLPVLSISSIRSLTTPVAPVWATAGFGVNTAMSK